MKRIYTLLVALAAMTLTMSAQPAARVQQVKSRVEATVARLAGQQKPSRLTEEDIMAACPDSVVTWVTDDDGSLVPESKTLYTYDSKKRIVTETEYEWDDEWELLTKTTNTYEGDVLVYAMVEDSEDWFGTGLKKVSYTYDAAGNVTVELTQKVQSDGSLTDSYRHTYTYDAQGRLTEDLDENWSGSAWRYSEKEVSTYEGEKVTTQSFDWDAGTSSWVLSDYSVAYVNAQGMPYREESYEQDEETGEFVLFAVSEITYDANGLPLSMKMMYDMGTGEMVEMGSGTFAYEFNAAGLPTKITSTTKIDFFGLFTEESTSVTYYYYGDGAHVDNAAVEPVVTARRYYGMDGKETTGAVRGLYIVVTEYADGTRTTVKSVRR